VFDFRNGQSRSAMATSNGRGSRGGSCPADGSRLGEGLCLAHLGTVVGIEILTTGSARLTHVLDRCRLLRVHMTDARRH